MAEDKSLPIDVVRQMLAEQSKQNAEMLASVIQELKKPTLLEQKAIDAEVQKIQAANEERRANSEGIKQQMREKKGFQAICTHKHRDGNTHGVFIMEKAPSPGYIHCQLCHANIRPVGKPEKNADVSAIYDVSLFNRMFQELPSSEMFQ